MRRNILGRRTMAHILTLSNMYPPHHYGGYELSCRDVMERFRRRGHDVEVLTTTMRVRGVEDPPNERATGIRRDLTFYWSDHRLVSPPLLERRRIERANQSALAAALDDVRPDVVSAWNMGALSLGLLTTITERNIPLVLNVCDAWPLYGPKLDAWIRLFTGRSWLAALARPIAGAPTSVPDLGRTATFCFVSDAVRRWVEYGSGWSPGRSTVVFSGIERADFPPPEGPRRPWRWRMLSVGRLDERKGIHVAIEAMGSLPGDTRLEVVGRGDAQYEERLRRTIAQRGLGDRVRFDVVDRSVLAARYRDADVFVFPTLWEEPFGLVPLEAMACGTPVVATGTGGSGEFLVDGFNCLLIPPGDPVALAAAVRRLAEDEDLRARLVAGGFTTAAQLDIDHLADALESWHVAASERFRSGIPAHRRLDLQRA